MKVELVKLWLFSPYKDLSDSAQEFYAHVGDLIRQAQRFIAVCVAWITRREVLRPLLEKIRVVEELEKEREKWGKWVYTPQVENWKVFDEACEILGKCEHPDVLIWFNAQDLGRSSRFPTPEIDEIFQIACRSGTIGCEVVGGFGHLGSNMHLKVVCADDIVILGSMNFSYFSENNYELMVEMRNRKLSEQIVRWMGFHSLRVIYGDEEKPNLQRPIYCPDLPPPTSVGFHCGRCGNFRKWEEYARIVSSKVGWYFLCKECSNV